MNRSQEIVRNETDDFAKYEYNIYSLPPPPPPPIIQEHHNPLLLHNIDDLHNCNDDVMCTYYNCIDRNIAISSNMRLQQQEQYLPFQMIMMTNHHTPNLPASPPHRPREEDEDDDDIDYTPVDETMNHHGEYNDQNEDEESDDNDDNNNNNNHDDLDIWCEAEDGSYHRKATPTIRWRKPPQQPQQQQQQHVSANDDNRSSPEPCEGTFVFVDGKTLITPSPHSCLRKTKQYDETNHHKVGISTVPIQTPVLLPVAGKNKISQNNAKHQKRRRMSVQALQQQMKKLESKIQRAATLELHYLNQSKQVRENRSRMMVLHERMRQKMMQSFQTSPTKLQQLSAIRLPPIFVPKKQNNKTTTRTTDTNTATSSTMITTPMDSS